MAALNLVAISSGNDLLSTKRLAIIWTNAEHNSAESQSKYK